MLWAAIKITSVQPISCQYLIRASLGLSSVAPLCFVVDSIWNINESNEGGSCSSWARDQFIMRSLSPGSIWPMQRRDTPCQPDRWDSNNGGKWAIASPANLLCRISKEDAIKVLGLFDIHQSRRRAGGRVLSASMCSAHNCLGLYGRSHSL